MLASVMCNAVHEVVEGNIGLMAKLIMQPSAVEIKRGNRHMTAAVRKGR